ncbi:hypothetical protein Kpol_2001p74 [Vanderwaltozyma polyspora DSM 70294]|uniref:histidine kinase n=1 Tax=Vanderwaltozyma polyspora (strain ATCC 22028 / DSM 70294 / BCRC 21397 / CBS 2163 / NBRC 10782 / NRRL Y-8283 / UCD 57-17) TaxID=436907 RepID=A7TGV3_VANPO|nr:uncharacterized protein Kpol_2001p74 [Vanderwaltozyma polyspora DSM 70294]EDO18566.1 hypothetical protein Kpol_2001p74 [Vanderwaltozyma polyspora DSM 70294]
MRQSWRKAFKPPYRITIRAQLTALVSLVAIISLIILAVTTGVYFTENYKELRSGRLNIAAKLKSSQIDQTLNYLFYQCRYLTSRDTLQNALINYEAGNKTYENWIESENVVQKFLSSSDLFYVARLYDLNFKQVVNATNNGTGDLIPNEVLSELFPLSTNQSLPSSLNNDGILTDPVLNGSIYLMSMSLPILTNPSIILSSSRVYGYITIVMSADGLKNVYLNNTALENSNVTVISAIYNDQGKVDGFHFVFEVENDDFSTLIEYPIQNGTYLSSALVEGKSGSIKKTKYPFNRELAIGYSPCSFSLSNWVALVTQPEAVFLSPSTKLEKIISGTVVAIAVFVCLITFPLSHWAVKPIVRLQKATELISQGRGLKPTSNFSNGDSSSTSDNWRESVESHVRASLGIFKSLRNNGSNELQSNDDMNEINERSSKNNSTGDNIKSSDNDSSSSFQRYTTSNLVQARVPVYGRFLQDELSELTDTFNAMTNALDQHYTLLEDRVRARTKQLEAAKIEAEAANEAKTVFIANISHELRTPLNGILGMTAISMEEDDSDKIKENLKLIFRSGELLLHILTELLTFSKNVLKRTNLEKRDFCITEIALQIKSIFGKVARDQHVKLLIILMPNRIRSMVLWGDSNRIIQIVMNLVSNALKFTPIDGKVDVRIKLLGEYDEERSMNDDYKEVYIKSGTELPIGNGKKTDMVRKKIQELSEKDCIEGDTASSGSHMSGSSKIDKLIEDEEKNSFSDNEDTNNDIEILSMTTSSTRSYDDAALQRQFKKTPDLDDKEETLGVELSEPKTWVISVEVEDTGPGIEPKLQEAVFEPFVQGDQALSRQYGGTGLGLSICRQLATMMHGTMKLESTVGVGSKFIFTVPLKQTREIHFDDEKFEDEFNAESKKNRRIKFKIYDSSKSHDSNDEDEEGIKSSRDIDSSNNEHKDENGTSPDNHSKVRLDRPFLQSTGTATSSQKIPTLINKEDTNIEKSIRILVAEDNHVNQEVIKRMLNLEKIDNIDLACDGQDAFDKVKSLADNEEYYDIIFMDVQMPKVDGLVSTKMIRKDLNYKHPIVALTAFANDDNIKECLDAGMDGFLGKPIKRPKLKQILQEYIDTEKQIN